MTTDGERTVRARYGLDDRMERLAARMVAPAVSEDQQAFFATLPFVVVGAVADGTPWATVLAGLPGFVEAGETRVRVRAVGAQRDPVRPRPGDDVGLLGIDLGTRRRNRVNGSVVRADDRGFTLAVAQAFGNCPQYIHPRRARLVRAPGPVATATTLATLDDTARAQLATADTCFVASWAGPGGGGADVSHRGGPAGFVRVEGDTLHIPDFAGNNLFMTLGNLVSHPRAGLVFPEFGTGGLLQVAGAVELVWEPERAWRLHVEAAVRTQDALPLRWEGLGGGA